MIIISDTSPIINLAIIGHLDLLPKIFGKVIIPQAVYDEITEKGTGKPGASEVKEADWIEVKSCTNELLVRSLCLVLDKGEAEAITLSLELKSDLLLIDERIGRQVAKDYDLNILGLLGIIIQAKNKNLIQAVKPLLDDLIQKANFFINRKLYDEILKAANEF